MQPPTNATKKTISIDAPKGSTGKRESWNNDEWKANWGTESVQRDPRDLQDPSIVTCQILIVNPDAAMRAQVSGMLADMHHKLIEAKSTEDATEIVSQKDIDLVLIDLNTPDVGGIKFCELIREEASTRLIPIFIQSSEADSEMEARAITAGAAEFLIGPLKPNPLRARVQASLRHKAMLSSLDDSESVLFSLAKSVEDRDPDLGEHCQRLAIMAAAMGLAIGLPSSAIRTLQRGGYVHDIGKIGIPDQILFKAGPLTAEEWLIMKSHAERGEKICAHMRSMMPVLPIIRHHHERWDGSGYPDGLKGEETPLLARILQVVDIYDALTTERPYKRAYSPEDALTTMREEAEKGWRHPVLVEVFAELLPMFRVPSVMDTSRLSLQALAVTLEEFRKDSVRSPEITSNAQRPSPGFQVG